MVSITKASGAKEEFDEGKLVDSLVRANVGKSQAARICKQVTKGLYPNISSQRILDSVVDCLEREDPSFAARYNLKRAMMELGPTGFPFEKFIAKLLASYGYDTQTNQILMGRCVSHEVDVVAEKRNEYRIAECKYHNSRGVKTNVRTALYVHARVLDIQRGMKKASPGKTPVPLLVTNTKCTSQAIAYAECVDMRVIAWKYPKKRGLESLIEKKQIFPITVFPSLTKRMKKQLVQKNILLVRDILSYSLADFIRTVDIQKPLAQKIYLQASHLMQTKKT